MPAPTVYTKEQDKSVRVPSGPGIYAGIVVDSERGPEEPTLITSIEELLNTFTPLGKLRRGSATGLLSAITYLGSSNKLWVVRAVSDTATHAGLLLGYDNANDELTSSTVNAGSNPTAFTSWGATGKLLVYASSRGAWANGLVSVLVRRTTQNLPAGTNSTAFHLDVYVNGELRESHLVSLWEEEMDGYGRTIFAESVVNSKSKWIRVLVNPAARSGGTNSRLFASNTTLPTTPIALGSGSSGGPVGLSEFMTAADKFRAKLDYPLRLLLDGGFPYPAYQVHLVQICEARRDCVAILSVPAEKQDTLSDLTDYATNTTSGVGGINSSFAALYTPNIKVYVPDFDDYVFAPPDGFAAAAISKTASDYEIWYPVGGWIRGKLNVLDLKRKYTDGEMDLIYDSGINPIRFKRGKGIAIWGQKTLYRVPSALDRLNVRFMLIEIQSAISEFLENFLFELNDESTRNLITSLIEQYMEGVKARKGVTDYLVVCDDSNNTPDDIDNYRLNVDLYVKPTRAIEYIHFKTVITPTGVSFDEVR